jgi:hypothetical protein
LGRKTASSTLEARNVEVSVVSDYVRLCIGEGVTPEEAFKTLRQKLRASEEFNIQAAKK